MSLVMADGAGLIDGAVEVVSEGRWKLFNP